MTSEEKIAALETRLQSAVQTAETASAALTAQADEAAKKVNAIEADPSTYTVIVEYAKVLVPLGSAAIALAISLLGTLSKFDLTKTFTGQEKFYFIFGLFLFSLSISIASGTATMAFVSNYLRRKSESENDKAKFWKLATAVGGNISFISFAFGGGCFLLIAIALLTAQSTLLTPSSIIDDAREIITSKKKINDSEVNFKSIELVEGTKYKMIFVIPTDVEVTAVFDARSGSLISMM